MPHRYGLVIDLERCIGCHTCTVACKLENGFENGSGIHVQTIGGPHRDTPAGKAPDLRMHFLPITCMHCDDPPCMEACPLKAVSKNEDGIVLVDEAACDGCGSCVDHCPYHAVFLDGKEEIARKCTLCSHRLAEGQMPFCVICCETEAIYFRDLKDSSDAIQSQVENRRAAALNPEKGTGPGILYCPTRYGRIH